MDRSLVAWARAVKSRGRHLGRRPPPLWFFSDAGRSNGLIEIVSRLPAGLCGIVFRHDRAAGRAALAQSVWRICRNRRLAMTAAAPPLGFHGPGRHLRGGWGHCGHAGSSSAHGPADIVRARRAGCGRIFLSPVFPTASHPGAPVLGPVLWAKLARGGQGSVIPLGGIDGQSVRRLPRWVRGAGAIGALLPG